MSSGSSKYKGGKTYTEVGEVDETVDMDLAVNPFDDAIEEEEKKKVSDDAEDESDDSDDMDAELDALENSVQITADEDDVDTDEDADESKKVE